MRTEISFPSVMLNVREVTNQTGRVQPASWRQRIEMLLYEIFEGREEFLGLTPD